MDCLRTATPPKGQKKQNPVSPRKAAEEKVTKQEQNNVNNIDLKKRLSMLRRTTGIDAEHVKEYQRLEVLRQSINRVKKDAEVNKSMRKNPKGLYGNIKSKVGANIKTTNKTQKSKKQQSGLYSLRQSAKTARAETGQDDTINDETVDITVNVQNESKEELVKDTRESNTTPEPAVAEEPNFSSPEKEQVDPQQQEMMNQIIKNIQEKYPEKEIQGMSEEELLQEVQKEMVKQQAPEDEKPAQEDEKPLKQVVSEVQVVKAPVEEKEEVVQAEPVPATQPEPEHVVAAQEESMLDQMVAEKKEKSPEKVMKAKKSVKKTKTKSSKKTASSNLRASQQAAEPERATIMYKNKPVSSPTNKQRVGRIGSPVRFRQNQKAFDDDVNKGLAREMYIDSQCNVVNPRDGSPGRVKPGQMNVFQPMRPIGDYYRDQATSINLDKVEQEYGATGGDKNILRNKILNDKTVKVQMEFENLMNDMVQRRNGALGLNSKDLPGIEEIIDAGLVALGDAKKHKSPVKRLIAHKNSATKHKQRVYDGVSKGDYSQTYNIAPGQTVIMEAQGGELPYDMAHKKPSKFFNHVLNQDIKRMDVSNKNDLEFVWTQRPLLRLITCIKVKIEDRIVALIGEEFRPDVEAALAEGGDIEGKIIDKMKDEEIDLVDNNNEGMLKKQLNVATKQAEGEEIDEVESPTIKGADLKMDKENYREIHNDVVKYVRRTSLLVNAKELKELQNTLAK